MEYDGAEELEEVDNNHYLSIAKNAFEESESFLDTGHKTRWRRNYSLAQSEHPQGSKYNSAAYAHRSRQFRGKTEASLRKNEAALAVALFSNSDVVSISAENQDDNMQDEVAQAIHRLTNYRLDKSVKWFLTAIGAYHDAMIVGDVVSEQYWEYEKGEDGAVVVDQPAIDLHPLEHVHISPNADWRDPINSSPYLIVEFPMYVGDVKERMEKGDWIEYEESEIQRAAKTFRHSSISRAREGDEQTVAKDGTSKVTDFDTVYVHKNMIREDGKELIYYTLGTELLLSDPVPINAIYPHTKNDKRPFVWGTATIEPHKTYRRSLVDRVASTQAQSNDIANQRFDNVKQVLNKRKYAKRGMGVDYSALIKNVPGGVVLMDELDAVKEEGVSDITGSSYQEQNMINVDFDELAGSFSNASVATNRNLNETVGGMNLLNSNSNTLTEYQLRVLVETWVEPVIRQVVEMIQFYEDDEVIQKITNTNLTHADFQIPIEVKVSVGFGSTDPQQKIQKLVYGIQAITNVVATSPPGQWDIKALSAEVFGALGYNDGDKFFEQKEQEDPRIEQMVQEIQRLTKIIETKQIETQGKMQLEDLKGRNKVRDLLIELQADRQIKLTDMALTRGVKLKELEQRTGTDAGKLDLEFLKEINRRMDINNQQRELSYKMRTGNEGI